MSSPELITRIILNAFNDEMEKTALSDALLHRAIGAGWKSVSAINRQGSTQGLQSLPQLAASGRKLSQITRIAKGLQGKPLGPIPARASARVAREVVK